MKKISFFLLLFLACSCSSSSPKYYRIALDPSWYPLELSGREKNVIAFSIELLQQIAKREKLQLSLVRMNWENLLPGLREKKYQAVLSTLTPYLFYQQQYSFSTPYLLTGPALVLPLQENETSLEEMQGKEIAVIRGSEAILLLQVYPDIIIRSYDSVPEALNALATAQVDAAFIDFLLAQSYVNDLFQNKLKVASNPLTDQGLRMISLYRASPRLMEQFDKGLSALKKSGEYEKLMQKWGLLSQMELSDENLNRQIEAFLDSVF